ncbi:MAG: hypothetical protein DMD69_03490 [Gemmatimonadetes bacterium]|nr:MAG: hypothetical protein DMD69_03490 [Gemmatimonadota bacterium]
MLLLPALSVKRLALPAAALGLWGQVLGAQDAVVYGTVHGESVGPLRSAEVVVIGPNLGTLTDRGGKYRLSRVAPGVVIVRARFIGYVPAFDTVSVAAGDSVEASFVLRPSVTDGLPFVVLGPVVVTAAKRSQLLDQAITSVAVVSDTELARRAVNTVDEAVDKAPGVQFLYGQVNIRGSTGYVQGLGSRVLMLVDGVPANHGGTGRCRERAHARHRARLPRTRARHRRQLREPTV